MKYLPLDVNQPLSTNNYLIYHLMYQINQQTLVVPCLYWDEIQMYTETSRY